MTETTELRPHAGIVEEEGKEIANVSYFTDEKRPIPIILLSTASSKLPVEVRLTLVMENRCRVEFVVRSSADYYYPGPVLAE